MHEAAHSKNSSKVLSSERRRITGTPERRVPRDALVVNVSELCHRQNVFRAVHTMSGFSLRFTD